MEKNKITSVTAIIMAIVCVCTLLWGSGILKKEPQETNPPAYIIAENSHNRSDPVPTEKPSNSNQASNIASQSSNPPRIENRNLFEFPLYNDSDYFRYTGGCYYFCSSVEDSRGYFHYDSYCLKVLSKNKSWVRYDLNGEYNTLSGTLYWCESSFSVSNSASWLEFYNGEEWFYTTDKLTENNPILDFKIDISGVKYLTIYFCSYSDIYSANIIADPLVIE